MEEKELIKILITASPHTFLAIQKFFIRGENLLDNMSVGEIEETRLRGGSVRNKASPTIYFDTTIYLVLFREVWSIIDGLLEHDRHYKTAIRNKMYVVFARAIWDVICTYLWDGNYDDNREVKIFNETWVVQLVVAGNACSFFEQKDRERVARVCEKVRLNDMSSLKNTREVQGLNDSRFYDAIGLNAAILGFTRLFYLNPDITIPCRPVLY